MKIVWKIKRSLSIVDAAILHHINDIRESYKRPSLFKLSLIDYDDAVQIYKINYFENGINYIDGDDLASIKLRKLNESTTEVTIFDSYWSSMGSKEEIHSFIETVSSYSYKKHTLEDTEIEKKLSERQKLREVILYELNKRVEEDGLFEDALEPPQTKKDFENTTIQINGDNSGNIIIGNDNGLNT